MEQKPPQIMGMAWGLGLILGLGLVDIGMVALSLTAPVSPLTVVRLLAVLASLGVLHAIVRGVMTLNGARYRLLSDVLAIDWGQHSFQIPLGSVLEIRPGHAVDRVKRFRGARWPGYWFGWGRITGWGPVLLMATGPRERLLLIKTHAGSIAISPENPDRFLDRFAALQASVDIPAGPDSWYPAGTVYLDAQSILLLATGGVLNLTLFFLISIKYGRLPYELALHFDLTGVPDRIGHPRQLFVLAGVGLLIWLVNGAIGNHIWKRGEKLAAYGLWAGAIVVQLLLLLGLNSLV